MGKAKTGKRGQNEGSIYQRGDGLWVAAVSLGYDQDGKLLRKVVYGKTHEEARGKLISLLSDQQRGIPIPTERQTVARFLDSWLTDVVKDSTRPKTYRTYSDLIKHHIAPVLGKKQLVKLTPQDVQRFLKNKLESGLSARTVKHINDTLRAALNVGMTWGLVHRNVAALVKPPRIEKQEMKVFTPEQARAFLESVKGHRLEALFWLALTLGLRRGELLGLRWADIDLDAGTLRVNQALQRVSGELELTELKTEKSRRALPMTPLLIGAMRAHRTRQLEERLALGERWHDSGLVFCSTIGTPLEPRNLNRTFDALVKNASLPKIRLHDTRHSCATLLLAQGVPPRTIMEILGHSQISLTMNTYSHVLPAMKQEAIGMMDSILGGK
jgi:integrase